MKKILRWGLSIACICWLWPAAGFAIENSECFECHSDEGLTKESTDNILKTEITEFLYVDEDKFNHSVHNINGITCVDCHSDIEELNYDEEVPHQQYLNTVCCASCHEEAGDDFKNSVHMKMRNKGITMTCYACHGYHYVKHMEGASVTERENSICLKCHNPYQFHDWLPSRDSHFAYVECVVCHAPDVPRHINLKLYDLVTDTFYKSDKLFKVLGMESEQFMGTIDGNKDGVIDSAEFDNLVLILKQKNIHAVFRAELVADINSIAHHVNRGTAEKTCRNCHSAESPYFNAVSLIFSKDDGTVERYNVARPVLESYHVSHFYLLAGTRMKLMDKIGIFLFAGGACAVFIHFTVRVLTIPLRRKKDQDEEV